MTGDEKLIAIAREWKNAPEFVREMADRLEAGIAERDELREALVEITVSAVTFWGKRDLRVVLRKALDMLDQYYGSAERGEQEGEAT